MSVRIEHPAAHVAELVMDRPQARNAISTAQAEAMIAAYAELVADPAVSVVLLTSAVPGTFCVGADLKERAGFSDVQLRDQRAVFARLFPGLVAVAVPTIAVVEGYALGGGCELALCCDLIVADRSATFGLPEVGLGLIPGGGGTQVLSRRIGLNAAADLIFTGRRVSADDPAAARLVDRLTPTGEARAVALELAAAIATRSPVSLRAAKRALRGGFDLPLADGLALEGEAWADAAFSPDRAEGIAAFNAKRPPRWPSWGER